MNAQFQRRLLVGFTLLATAACVTTNATRLGGTVARPAVPTSAVVIDVFPDNGDRR